jgi:hypothetical protein
MFRMCGLALLPLIKAEITNAGAGATIERRPQSGLDFNNAEFTTLF